MTRQVIDATANENLSTSLAKVNDNFSELYGNRATATATAGAATVTALSGKVTSEALVTAAAASYTLTITNTAVSATDIVFASVAYGTSTTGEPAINRVTPANGSLVVIVRNEAAAAALNGTIVVSFFVHKV